MPCSPASRRAESKSVFVRYLHSLGGHPTADAVLAALTTTLAWGPLMRKRISRLTAESLPWWMRLFGTLIGASAPAARHQADDFLRHRDGRASRADEPHRNGLPRPAWPRGRAGRSLRLPDAGRAAAVEWSRHDLGAGREGRGLRRRAGESRARATQQGGPGFLTHSGYAHGGNGYEGIAFLIEQFGDVGLSDPADPAHGVDLEALAAKCAAAYGQYKADKKSAGSLDIQKIPGVNHPVFKDKPVNYDPREVFVRDLFAQRGEYNVFHEFYHTLVEALFEAGVSRNVYCVNIDAVIAALLLKMLWRPYRDGSLAGERSKRRPSRSSSTRACSAARRRSTIT